MLEGADMEKWIEYDRGTLNLLVPENITWPTEDEKCPEENHESLSNAVRGLIKEIAALRREAVLHSKEINSLRVHISELRELTQSDLFSTTKC